MMKRFIEIFEDNVRFCPERPAVTTDDGKNPLTYAELDELSAKVYAYLSSSGFGKEDMLLISMPRGTSAVAVMLGVLKTGAAFTVVEDTYPQERIDFIRRDFSAKLVIDSVLFEKMLTVEDKPSHTETDPHDACLAVYTSGTTGNPKGILHEYGKLDICVSCSSDKRIGAVEDYEKFAIITPMNFVATTINIFTNLCRGNTVCIVGYDTVKSHDRYYEYLEREKINWAFMTPSLLRLYNRESTYPKAVTTGGELAANLWHDKLRIINYYSMSEAAFSVTCFPIDRPYAITPVGKPIMEDLEIQILDNDGRRLPDGQTGEVCFVNEYTRGYINLPEQTARAFRGGLYHTGDLGYLNENGDLVICGRADDMIKINGNRVEPAEIEAAVREIFQIRNVVAKGIKDCSRAFVALYYLKSESEKLFAGKGASELNRKLSKRLPQYMLPSVYVGLDEMPMNTNGKISRRLLPDPELGPVSAEAAFIEPETETERRICAAMAEVLKLDRISANADFFEYGGDSMRAIEFIGKCGIPELTNSNLYTLRTPKKLAALCDSRHPDVTEENAVIKTWQLLPGQELNYRFEEEDPGTVRMNLPRMFRLREDADPQKTAAAVDRAILAHPALLTRIFRTESGEIRQMYDETMFRPTPVTELTAAEFERFREAPVIPFGVFDERLYRSEIIRTESGNWLFLDMSHMVMDGMSVNLLLKDIVSFASDEAYVPPEDCWFRILGDFATAAKDEIMACDIPLPPLRLDRESNRKHSAVQLLAIVPREPGKNYNLLMMTALAMAIAEFNGEKRSALYWMYTGRDDAKSMAAVGELVSPMPFVLELTGDDTPETLISEARKQTEYAFSHSHSPFFAGSLDKMTGMVRYIYQKNVLVKTEYPELFAEELSLTDKMNIAFGVCGVNVVDNDDTDKIFVAAKYSADNLDKESMVRLKQSFEKALAFLSAD